MADQDLWAQIQKKAGKPSIDPGFTMKTKGSAGSAGALKSMGSATPKQDPGFSMDSLPNPQTQPRTWTKPGDSISAIDNGAPADQEDR